MARDRVTLCFGNVLVAIHEWGTVIAWPDGTHVVGMPEDNNEYRKTAHEHGYGDDTLSLCRDHELLHVALCHWLGIPSPVMEACRLGGDMPGADIRRLEEAAVLAIQRFAKAMDVDLIHALAAWQR